MGRPRKNKEVKEVTQEQAAEVVAPAPVTAAPEAAPEAAPAEAAAPTVKEPKADKPVQTTADKLKARIKAGDKLLVLVTSDGLHLLYPKEDTPANRTAALKLSAASAGGKPLTFLNDQVTKD